DAEHAGRDGGERDGAQTDAPRLGLGDGRTVARPLGVDRRERDAVFALRDDDAERAVAAGGRVVVVELLAQMVRIDAHHRILPRIEVRAAIEHRRRDLVLFRRTPFERAVDEELEQPRVRFRAAERAARENLGRLVSDSVLLLVRFWLRWLHLEERPYSREWAPLARSASAFRPRG